MLKVFRDNLKYLSWILWLVVILFVFFMWADFGAGIGNRGPGGPATVARVGSREVTFDDFERQYNQLEGLYRQVYGQQFTPELARQMGLPMQALNQAVNQQVLLAEARRLGLSVTDEEVRDRILQERVFKDEQGRFVGREQYAEIVRNLRYASPAAFEAELREEILVRKLLDVLEANLYISDEEVEKAYREEVERARIRYVQLPRSRFLQGQEVPQAEVQAYFEANKESYRLPEQREAAYLLVDPSQLAGQVQIEEAKLREYYEDNPGDFERPEQVHARHILVKTEGRSEAEALRLIGEARARLQKGEGFAEVAQQVSDDPGSKASGGELGFFGRGQMVPAFEEAAFGAEPGAVVGPVQTQFGYHLIEVLEKRPAGKQPFAEASEAIRQRLAAERTRELAESRARELAKRLAKEKPKDAEAVKVLAQPDQGVTFGESGRFGRQEPVAGLGFAPALSQTAFEMQKGAVSEPIETPRGWAVLYLKEVHAPRVPELKDVEPRVRAALAREKQQEMAVQELRKAMAGGKSLDQVAAELNLEVKESAEFGVRGSIPGIGANPELAKAALAAEPGQIGGPVADAQGAILFEVTERKSWDPIQFAGVREETREQVKRQKLNQLEAALIEQRRREMEVRFDAEALEQFGIVAPGQAG